MRQLGCASHDVEPPDSATISGKGTKMTNSTSTIHKSYVASKQTSKKAKDPSLKKMQVKSSHQCSTYAVKFEDRSPEQIARQERCARGDAWEFEKIFELKGKEKGAFCSTSEERVLPAASTINSQER